MIGRIFKGFAFAALVGAVAVVMLVRSKLDRAARDVAERSLAGASALEHGAVHGRLWPPAAVVEDVRLRAAGGSKLFRAQRLVLPLSLWRSSTSMARFEQWTLELRVPRAGAVPGRMLLSGEGLPALAAWEASDGRVELRAGDSPASAALTLTHVHAARQGDTVRIDGSIEGTTGTLRVEGSFSGGRFAGHASLGPLDAVAAGALLVDPAQGVVRGGRVTFEGALAADARGVSLAGDVDALDVLVEGKGAPGAFEARLRAEGSRARVPLALGVDLARGIDAPRAFRDALAARERGER